jgi:uncharacterized protein
MKLPIKLLLGAASLAVTWQLLRGLRTALFEYQAFHAPPVPPVRPADAGALGLVDAEFPAANGLTIRGWYIPSRTGASVVIAGGSTSDRMATLAHARVISAGGTGALIFDWPGCGASDGRPAIGPVERAALQAAVDYVAARPDVSDGRIGLVGFSLGAYNGVLLGAQDQRLRAFALEGVFDEPWSQTRVEYRNSGRAAIWGALVGHYFGGLSRDNPSAIQAVAALAPRPILFVAGTNDQAVPVALSRAVFDAAGEPKTLRLIEGAGHGGYLDAEKAYGDQLRLFIETSLAKSVAAERAR